MAIKGRVRGGLDPAAGCAVECRDKRRRRFGARCWLGLGVDGLGRGAPSSRGLGVCRVSCGLQQCKELQNVGNLGVKVGRPGSLVTGLGFTVRWVECLVALRAWGDHSVLLHLEAAFGGALEVRKGRRHLEHVSSVRAKHGADVAVVLTRARRSNE